MTQNRFAPNVPARTLIALLAISAPITWAGASSALLATLRDAAYSYPLTRSAGHGVEAADSDQAAARWQRFPSVSFSSQSPSNTNSDPALNIPPQLAVTQPIWAGGGIDAGIESAAARYASSKAYYQQVAQDQAIGIVDTWYDWQRSQARQTILQESVDAHRKLKEQMAHRVDAGVSPEADLSLAVARLSQTQSDLAQAQAATRSAYSRLRQLTGVYLSSFTSPSFKGLFDQDTRIAPAQDWRARALSRDPQLQKLSSDANAAAADIKVQKSKLYPTFSVRYEKDFTTPQAGQGIFLQVTAQPGAGLSALSGVKAAAARSEAAQDARRDAELALERTIDTDLSDYASARDQLEVATLLRRSTRDVADSYSRQFVAGHKNWLDVLNAVREAVSARLSIADAQAQIGQTWWRLRLRAWGLDAATVAPS